MKNTENPSKFEKEYFTGVYEGRTREGNRVYKYHLQKIIQKIPQVKTILDIGCAYGNFLSFCDKAGLETYGMDISNFALKVAKKSTKANLILLNAETSPWPYKNNFFDVVTIFDVIEHVKNSDFLLSEAHRVLKPGGLLYATTPNNQGRMGKFLERFMPEDPTHINKKKGTEWKKDFLKVGFKNVEIYGVLLHGFPPAPSLRIKLESIGIPTMIRPIFFPIKFFTGTLFIFARKPL